MAGRQQFETVVASAARQSLVLTKNVIPGVTISAGQSYTVDIYAPSGAIGMVQNMYVFCNGLPTGATTGDLQFALVTTDQAGGFIACVTPKDKNLQFNRMQFYDQTSTSPPDAAGVVTSLRGAAFDSVVGLRAIFTNNTNASMTTTVSINVTWLKIVSA